MKKTIAWILAMVMVLALLTACRAQKAEKADHESQAASELQQTEDSNIQEEATADFEDVVVIDGVIILPDDEFKEEPEEIEMETQETTVPSHPVETSAPTTAPKETESSGNNGSIELPEDEF